MPTAGEIVLLPFPFTDLTSLKRRPALVLRTADARGDFPALAVTSQPQTEPALAFTQTDMRSGSLPRDSWIRADEVYTFNAAIVVARFGSLNKASLEEALRRACRSLGCHQTG